MSQKEHFFFFFFLFFSLHFWISLVLKISEWLISECHICHLTCCPYIFKLFLGNSCVFIFIVQIMCILVMGTVFNHLLFGHNKYFTVWGQQPNSQTGISSVGFYAGGCAINLKLSSCLEAVSTIPHQKHSPTVVMLGNFTRICLLHRSWNMLVDFS